MMREEVRRFFDDPELGRMTSNKPRTAPPHGAKTKKLEPFEVFAVAIDEGGLSRRDVAAFLGVDESRISSLKKGKSFPSAKQDAALHAMAVGCDLDAMFNGEYKRDPKWFPIRTTPLRAKIDALLDNKQTRRMLESHIDALFAQYLT